MGKMVAQTVKNPPAMRETWVGKIPWRRTWQPIPIFLPGEFPWMEEPGGLHSMGSQRVRHDWATKHSSLLQLQSSLCKSYIWEVLVNTCLDLGSHHNCTRMNKIRGKNKSKEGVLVRKEKSGTFDPWLNYLSWMFDTTTTSHQDKGKGAEGGTALQLSTNVCGLLIATTKKTNSYI